LRLAFAFSVGDGLNISYIDPQFVAFVFGFLLRLSQGYLDIPLTARDLLAGGERARNLSPRLQVNLTGIRRVIRLEIRL